MSGAETPPSQGAPQKPEGEDGRRRQLIEMTLDSLAEVGFVGSTLSEIAGRAGVSPGLVAHYFGDKDGLLQAAFRALTSRLGETVASRLKAADSPRARVQAVIDANLDASEFDQRTGSAWLAFWGQVLHNEGLRRVQLVYQKRMLSNLRHALGQLLPEGDARRLAAMIAAMIDGVWLRAALSTWREADSESARAMLTAFVDSRLEAMSPQAPKQAQTTLRKSYVGGRYIDGSGDRFTTSNPATGEILAEVEIAGAEAVDAAAAAAASGQKVWAAMSGAERGRILRKTADLLRAANAELADLETRDTGKPIQETIAVDVLSGADCLEYFAGLAGSLTGEHVDLGPTAFGYTRRELAEIFTEAGLPPGVFNVVQGGVETGRLLSRHPGIAKISLTGAVETGRKVMADASSTLKAVTMELGGKSPMIVFDDAGLDNAVSGALLANFYSAGEVCSNGTRVFVHRSVRETFLEKLLARTAALKVGDPRDPTTQVGALISRAHMDKVLGYIEQGKAAGAKLLIGGERVTDGALARGNFVSPAIFADCSDDMSIVREEIFGPVMSVLDFDDEDEVIARANDTEFGLSAAVFTRDLARAHRVIARLEAGTCWINQYNITPIELPFGGYKQSGIGRENGRAAIEHYTQLKSVYVALTDIDAPY
eukprot:gene16210-16387_t